MQAVALDRQSIEKKDFPIGRRGYDPEAVDGHLSALADEVDLLKRSARQRSETVATTTSEQVRAVIAAAEASAEEITRQADAEAREISDDATAESRRVKEEADQRAHDYVGKVAEATSAMLQRVDAMQGELDSLLDALRTGANRVNADLQLLEGNLGELASVAGRPRFEREEPVAARAATGREARVAVEDPEAPGAATADPSHAFADELVPDPDAPGTAGTAASAASAGTSATAEADGDDEGARLVALDMALSGTARDETDRYLAEHFELADRTALLDEVYATVEG
jgi:cell division septum initiation protein DivIVA